MNQMFFDDLRMHQTDVEGTLSRLNGDEEAYAAVLAAFPQDPTMAILEATVDAGAWDDAFTAAHALKGVAGNLGMTPLFHSLSELVIAIRTGKTGEMDIRLQKVKTEYQSIASVILNHTLKQEATR